MKRSKDHLNISKKMAKCHDLCGKETKLEILVQLNKCETDPYFLQNFQCTTMFISAFCKICELNTEREIVFVLTPVDSQGDITQV